MVPILDRARPGFIYGYQYYIALLITQTFISFFTSYNFYQTTP